MTRTIVTSWFSPFSLMLARMLPRFTTEKPEATVVFFRRAMNTLTIGG